MKKLTLLLIVLFFSFNLFAQKGISFQGIARDAQGNAITGENVSVNFTIGSFNETQNLETDDFGIFSATIGSVNTVDFDDLLFANMDENLEVVVDGQLIYNDKFNTVPYAKAAENGVPVGSIMPFAGPKSNIPEGWLYCDGTSYASTGIFGKLYDAIGYAWGDDAGKFRVPDLRGYFLRGADDGSGIDPDSSTRTAKYSGGNTGDAVGSFQNDEYGSHNHPASSDTEPDHDHTIYGEKASDINDGNDNDHVLNNGGSNDTDNITENTGMDGGHNHVITISNAGGNETRPVNAGVNFIIKY